MDDKPKFNIFGFSNSKYNIFGFSIPDTSFFWVSIPDSTSFLSQHPGCCILWEYFSKIFLNLDTASEKLHHYKHSILKNKLTFKLKKSLSTSPRANRKQIPSNCDPIKIQLNKKYFSPKLPFLLKVLTIAFRAKNCKNKISTRFLHLRGWVFLDSFRKVSPKLSCETANCCHKHIKCLYLLFLSFVLSLSGRSCRKRGVWESFSDEEKYRVIKNKTKKYRVIKNKIKKYNVWSSRKNTAKTLKNKLTMSRKSSGRVDINLFFSILHHSPTASSSQTSLNLAGVQHFV